MLVNAPLLDMQRERRAVW